MSEKMVGLGTIVDVVAIIGGGLVGMIFQQFISPQLRRIVMQTLGLAVIFVGMAGTYESYVTNCCQWPANNKQ